MSSSMSSYQITISVSLWRRQRNGGQVLALNTISRISKSYFMSFQGTKEINKAQQCIHVCATLVVKSVTQHQYCLSIVYKHRVQIVCTILYTKHCPMT